MSGEGRLNPALPQTPERPNEKSWETGPLSGSCPAVLSALVVECG